MTSVMPVMQVLGTFSMGFLTVFGCWVVICLMGGGFYPEYFGRFYALFPSDWGRMLVLSLPIALGNLFIGRLMAYDPFWAPPTFVFLGVTMPVLFALLMVRRWPSLEVVLLVAAIAVLAVWLGKALGRVVAG